MSEGAIYNVRKISDLKDMLQQSEKLYSNNTAFLIRQNDGDYTHITYKQFKNDVDALGTAFIDMGLKDKFIAVIGENRYEWCLTYLATVNGTGVIVPLDKELPAHEIENLIVRSEASAVVFSGKYSAPMEQLAQNLPAVKYFICMDSFEQKGNFLYLNDIVKRGYELIENGDRRFIDAIVNPEAMNMLLFTSGTTDLAKGVMLSHRNICSNMMATCSVLYINSSDVFLSILPLHHTYECTNGFLIMIYNGCTIAFNDNLKNLPRNLSEVKPTILMVVPLILEGIYKKIWQNASKNVAVKHIFKIGLNVCEFTYYTLGLDFRKKLCKKVHEFFGGRIRLVISGAAALDPSVVKGFRAMGVRVIQGYGLTECSPIVCVATDKASKDDSVGLPLPGTQIRIDSPNSEGIGEIVVKSPSVMLGYYKNSLATEKVIKDGWFYTGDLGRIDEQGFCYVTGRKKNVIVTKNGKNIYPEEVEAYLNKSPYILESMVYGKTDEEDEIIVSAQIVPDVQVIKDKFSSDNEPSINMIYDLINEEVKNVNKLMPSYKRIKDFNIRMEEFAKTTTKKIKRYVEKIS